MNNKVITINIVTDAMGILSDGSLDGNVYMFDNNRLGGSTGEGTASLQCRIDCGSEKKPQSSKLVWNIVNLCPDVRVDIVDIKMSGNAIEVEKRYYESTDVAYWIGTVKKSFDTEHCTLFLKIGESEKIHTTTFSFKGRKEATL